MAGAAGEFIFFPEGDLETARASAEKFSRRFFPSSFSADRAGIERTGADVVAVMERVSREIGYPKTIRVDNGPEFVSKELDLWAFMRGVTLDFSRPGKPTDNAFIESFNFSYWGYGSAIATAMVAGVLMLSWLVGRLDAEQQRDE